MTTPYELAATMGVGVADPNTLVIGPSFYYSDASPVYKQYADANQLVEFDVAAIVGQMEIIASTALGTEEFEPTFGSDGLKRLFGDLVQSDINALELDLLSAWRKWLGGRADFYSFSVSTNNDTGDVIAVCPFRSKISGKSHTYLGNLTALSKNMKG